MFQKVLDFFFHYDRAQGLGLTRGRIVFFVFFRAVLGVKTVVWLKNCAKFQFTDVYKKKKKVIHSRFVRVILAQGPC